jgi:hypothetical protein
LKYISEKLKKIEGEFKDNSEKKKRIGEKIAKFKAEKLNAEKQIE